MEFLQVVPKYHNFNEMVNYEKFTPYNFLKFRKICRNCLEVSKLFMILYLAYKKFITNTWFKIQAIFINCAEFHWNLLTERTWKLSSKFTNNFGIHYCYIKEVHLIIFVRHCWVFNYVLCVKILYGFDCRLKLSDLWRRSGVCWWVFWRFWASPWTQETEQEVQDGQWWQQ